MKKHSIIFSMDWKLNSVLLLVIIPIISSCDLFKIKDTASENVQTSDPIARVLDKYLYPEDIQGITPNGISEVDSTYIIEKYIDKWIKQQLLIKEAKEKITINEVELERKIQDLRYELMVYEYQKYYISDKLNTEVSNDEVKEYYEQNIDNFVLKQNIIKGVFVKLPREAPKVKALRRLIRSQKPEDKEELRSYCYRFATTYSLEDSVWLNFDEVIANTPLIGIPNKVQYLKRNSYVETSDDNYLYFLRINEYKISDQNSPVEFVADQIKAIIKNKRKVVLKDQLEQDIFKRAIRNNEFEIYQ